MIKCNVCSGGGDYPIYNDRGGYEFTIRCPKCCGRREVEEERDISPELRDSETTERQSWSSSEAGKSDG
jgi:hypothetical protein